MYHFGGGGGWGDPVQRDPHAVLDDVLGRVRVVEGAERDYGVVSPARWPTCRWPST